MRHRTHTLGGAVFVLIAALVASSCVGLRDDSGARPGDICEADSDCPGDQVCKGGYCTIERARSRRLDFRFYPSDSSTIAQRARGVTVDSTSPLDFVLQPTLVVQGRVEMRGGMQPPLRGEMALTRSGGPPLLSAPSVALDDSAGDSGRQFEVELLPGRYDIRYIPDEPKPNDTRTEPYPPVTWKKQIIEKPQRGGRISIRNLASIPQEDDLVRISGALSYEPASPGEDAESTALVAARVYAVGASRHSLESTETTTNGKGSFALNALPADEPTKYDLVVGPSPENPFVPTVRIPSDEITTESGALVLRSETDQRNLTDVDVGTFPQVSTEDPPTLNLEFVPPASQNADAPQWSKFRVVLRASNLQNGTFRRTTNLASDGTASLALLPVRYDGWLIPPADARVRTKAFSVDASETLEPAPIELEEGRRVEGRILDAQGVPVDGARVEFTPIASAMEEPPDVASRSSTPSAVASSDRDGRFTAWLEARPYRAVVVPPARTGLPRRITRVSAGAIRGDDPIELRIAPPLLVKGRIFGQYYDQEGRLQTSELPKTSIEVSTQRFGLRTKLGELSTRSDGSFFLILPGRR